MDFLFFSKYEFIKLKLDKPDPTTKISNNFFFILEIIKFSLNYILSYIFESIFFAA